MDQIFYTDSGLTTALAVALDVAQKTDDSLPAVDFQLYLGHPTAGFNLQASSNPGVDQITISVVDANAGSGSPATDVKLATTQVGLDSATGGAALNMGTSIATGAPGALTFWVRVEDSTNVAALNTDLSIETNDCDLVPV